MQGNNKNPYNNIEGYPDPTAYEAEKNIMKEEQNTWEEKKRISELIGVLKYIDEKKVDELAQALYMIAQDNPEIFKEGGNENECG